MSRVDLVRLGKRLRASGEMVDGASLVVADAVRGAEALALADLIKKARALLDADERMGTGEETRDEAMAALAALFDEESK